MNIFRNIDQRNKENSERCFNMVETIDFTKKLLSDQILSDKNAESNAPEPAYSDCSSSVAYSATGQIMHRVTSTESMSSIVTTSSAAICEGNSYQSVGHLKSYTSLTNVNNYPEDAKSISDDDGARIAWGFIDPFPVHNVEILRCKSHFSDRTSHHSVADVICTPKREVVPNQGDSFKRDILRVEETSIVDAFVENEETIHPNLFDHGSFQLKRVGSCGTIPTSYAIENLCKLRRVGSREKIRKVWNDDTTSPQENAEKTKDSEDDSKLYDIASRKRRQFLPPSSSLRNNKRADIPA